MRSDTIGLLSTWFEPLITAYGAWAVGVLVGLESLGLPIPGETALVSAAIYAGATGRLSIAGVLIAALGGAIVGDSLGYLAGRRLGWTFLVRHGSRIGLTESRLRIGRNLFARHGGMVVCAGRFVAFLRVLAASLAGALGLSWPRFALANITGAVVWVGAFGGGAYVLGAQVDRVLGPLGFVALCLGIAGIVTAVLLVRREEARLFAGLETVRPSG